MAELYIGPPNMEGSIRFSTTTDELLLQRYSGTEWVTVNSFSAPSVGTQPVENNNTPVIFAPSTVVLDFSDPSTQQDVAGCSMNDADSLSITMEVTTVNGLLNMPLTSGATYEEISGGLRFTGASVSQLNIELGGLQFTPVNIVGPPVEPQNGEINILVNDLDGGTVNANHTITVEVLSSGR